MELQGSYHPPESPMDPDDTPYPCKGCDQILEEGKAFELAGHRWHIDCFRCNTCGTLLDSDANLLLLGDGSLICNNCTYSCSACGNKIEDLAILTGDQAYCASCFRCRNCKRKIENLRYARTTQGMFCMECHDALMARRRKKSSKNQNRSNKAANGAMLLDKSLPSLPPSAAPPSAFSPDRETMSDAYSDSTPAELPASSPSERPGSNNLTLPPNAYRGHSPSSSQKQELEDTDNGFYIPMALDPNPAPVPTPGSTQMPMELDSQPPKPRRAESDTDYFRSKQSRRGLDAESRSNSATRVPSTGESRSRSPIVRQRERETDVEVSEGRKRRSSVNNNQTTEGTPRSSGHDSEGKFQLQEAPKRKKSISTSKQLSKGDSVTSPLDASSAGDRSKSAPSSAHVPLREQHINIGTDSPRTSLGAPQTTSPRVSQDIRNEENHASESSKTATPEPPVLPKRGDSLQKGPAPAGIHRKEVGGHIKSTSNALRDELHSRDATSPGGNRSSLDNQTAMNGGKVISRPMESPITKNSLDFPPRSKDRPGVAGDTFNSPRIPPQPPADGSTRHKNKASVSSVKSDGGTTPTSPGLPRHQGGSDLGFSEDIDRIMGDDHSLLKRVSNSVRHARSHSDRGSRHLKEQKWPKTPLNGTTEDMSSPLLSSPEGREDSSWYKGELKKERDRVAELEKRLEELEGVAENKTTIKAMSRELREKRSTMVVLDTQKEIVFRELETLTEHISAAKKSNEPLDLSNLSNTILRDFATSLEKLKDNMTSQIEELMDRKVNLSEETARLNQQRDRLLLEFEQLSSKNAQLADMNNVLVHQIQELSKSGGIPEATRAQVSGLGIYTHHNKDKSQISVDSREMRPSIAESQTTGSTLAHEHEHDAGAAIISAPPRMVEIRSKNKFNWRKASNVAKGATKGIKGAFSSTEQRSRDGGTPTHGLVETTPYSSTQNGEPPTTILPGRSQTHDMNKQGFGFFQQKKPATMVVRPIPNGNLMSEETQPPSKLFGAELEARAEYERASIPAIVSRCIEEVELRGMDLEGIYRKSGGAAQVQVIRDGFVQNNDFFISDPDLDINAVTSTLKQYFRKLPTPLITYPVYDLLIDSTQVQEPQERIQLMHDAITKLPPRHKDCLEFLLFHLARVVEREKENLMTSTNCAVVFAPTIMRPESIAREMSDTAAKNVAVQFLIDNCHAVFMGGNNS